MNATAPPDVGGPPSWVPPLPPNEQWPGPPERDDDDRSWRCTNCNLDWPDSNLLFGLVTTRWPGQPHEGPPCPVCLEQTAFLANGNPLTLEDAWSRKNTADFERYYDRRGQQPGPLTRDELDALSTPYVVSSR